MSNITLETQIKTLYEKARVKKEQSELSGSPSTFNNTLQSTIERMNEISDTVDFALKSLSDTREGGLKAEIDHAGSMHRKIMEEQHNLAALYQKINTNKET